MEYPIGQYRIEHRRLNDDVTLNVFSFWSNEPTLGYFQKLAQTSLRSYWRRADGVLKPAVRTSSPLPEAMVVCSQDGEEICRWSLTDEFSA